MAVKYLVFVLVLICHLFNLHVDGNPQQRKSPHCRVRKEFTFMSVSERVRFVNVLKRVSTEHPFIHRYVELVSKHPKLFNIVHNISQFFPWHRNYLLEMENLLRDADPGITLPYWDWSLVNTFPWRKAVLDIWTSLPWGLGGNGNLGDLCVTSGPFASRKWKSARYISDKGCLQRNFSGIPPGIMAIHRALRFPPKKFELFETYVRDFLHNALHWRVGGTMAGKAASLAPEFFLHHTFLDKIWADYQKQGPQYKWTYFKDKNNIIYNTTIPAIMMVDNNDLLGIRVCYKDPFKSYNDVHKRLKKYSIKKIQSFMSDGTFGYPFQDYHGY